MSQIPQQSDAPGQSPYAYGGESTTYGPASWSAMAIVAFAFSFIFCIPVFPLVGIILAVVGIIATSNGQRRGRGLAIAAIPISLVSFVVGGMLYGLIYVSYLQTMTIATATEALFQADSDELATATDAMLQLTTQDFQDSVSSEKLIGWVDGIQSKHGKLTSAQMATSGDRGTLFFEAKFVNGNAGIRLVLGQGMGSLERLITIDDIEVGGSSPRDFKPPPKTE